MSGRAPPRPGEPAAHVRICLALLPSGPDAVRRLRLHRDRAAVRPACPHSAETEHPASVLPASTGSKRRIPAHRTARERVSALEADEPVSQPSFEVTLRESPCGARQGGFRYFRETAVGDACLYPLAHLAAGLPSPSTTLEPECRSTVRRRSGRAVAPVPMRSLACPPASSQDTPARRFRGRVLW